MRIQQLLVITSISYCITSVVSDMLLHEYSVVITTLLLFITVINQYSVVITMLLHQFTVVTLHQ